MKKLLFLTAIALAAISCQDEENSLPIDNSSPQSQKFQVVQITGQGEIIPIDNSKTRSSIQGETALQFASEADYQLSLKEIYDMQSCNRLAYVDANDFISLQELAMKADEELEEIANTATSESDFITKYSQYVEKYKGLLITNKYDNEDLSLYVPDGDNVSTYLVNSSRKVVIGNEVKKISLSDDMSESDKAVYAYTPLSGETNIFNFQNFIEDKKKTTGRVELKSTSEISVHVGCQKKTWLGWKRDNNRDVYFQLVASPMYFTLPNATGDPYNLDFVRFHAFHNDGKIDWSAGGLKPGATSLSGKISVWTDITANTSEQVSYTNVFARYVGKYGTYGTHTLPKLEGGSYGGDFTLAFIR